MKITAAPTPNGTSVTLGDDSVGDYIVDPAPMPVEQRRAQVEELAMADEVFATGRGNRQTSFSWTVSREHADLASVAAFVWGHAASVPVDCSLAVSQDAGTVTFSTAVIVEVGIVEITGLNTKTRYRVTGTA
jgi:hypothetical protein